MAADQGAATLHSSRVSAPPSTSSKLPAQIELTRSTVGAVRSAHVSC